MSARTRPDRGRVDEVQFRYLVENAFDVILDCATSGRILYVSRNITEVLGVEPSSLVGTFLTDLLHPDDLERGVHAFSSAVRTGREIHETLRYRDSRGRWRSVEGRGKAYRNAEGKRRVVIIGRDVTDRVLAEENLTRIQQRLELHLQQLPIAVISWDFEGKVTEWNPAAERMFGYKKEEVLGQPASPLIEAVGDQADAMVRNLANLQDESSEPFRVTSQNRTKSGELLLCEWSIVPLHDAAGVMNGVITIADNVTERERARGLEEAAYKDPVTGMPNRRLFDDRLGACADSTRRRDDAFAVLYIDLDDFKSINDRHGHHVGDAVLAAVGLRLRVCIRDTDVVARLGGDEFGILLTHLDNPGYAEEVAERVLDSLRHPLIAGNKSFTVAASIGISQFPGDGSDAATLLRKADAAMYRAKQKGKCTYAL